MGYETSPYDVQVVNREMGVEERQATSDIIIVFSRWEGKIDKREFLTGTKGSAMKRDTQPEAATNYI